jgi:hypothetical protein
MMTNAARLALLLAFLLASPHPHAQTNRASFKVIGYYHCAPRWLPICRPCPSTS